MITFLPYKSFNQSAHALDSRRLNKQILEATQILECIRGMNDNGNVIDPNLNVARCHHPATLMWIGYEDSLKYYINCCFNEWIKRGKNNTRKIIEGDKNAQKPDWLNDTLILSHRSILMHKEEHYLSFGWEKSELLYYWPYTWSNKFNSRIFINILKYRKISANGKENYDKELKRIKDGK
jgi:hypothetical protein